MRRAVAIGCFAYFVVAVVLFLSGDPQEAETTPEPSNPDFWVSFMALGLGPIWLVGSILVLLFSLQGVFGSASRRLARSADLIDIALVLPGMIGSICGLVYSSA
jgi:hypothetical protein